MTRLAALVLLSAVSLAGPAFGDDQDKARAALERGEIRPLDQVLAAAKAAMPGDVVKLDLKRKKDAWLYKLKILTPAGKRREVQVDAKSLAILDADDDDD